MTKPMRSLRTGCPALREKRLADHPPRISSLIISFTSNGTQHFYRVVCKKDQMLANERSRVALGNGSTPGVLVIAIRVDNRLAGALLAIGQRISRHPFCVELPGNRLSPPSELILRLSLQAIVQSAMAKLRTSKDVKAPMNSPGSDRFRRVIFLAAIWQFGALSLCAEIAEPPAMPAIASSPTALTPPAQSPNQALAAMAKEIIIKSLKPEYEKRENWGHQSSVVDGLHWVQHDGGWHLEKQTKLANDGLWRMYSVRLNDPERNLRVRLTPPHSASLGRTAFQAFLTARLAVDARQEQWIKGVKGLNFHVEGEATVEVRLDVDIGIEPAKEGSFGTIEIDPIVSNVGLRLVDLSLKKLDLIHGDLARTGKCL